MSMTDGDENKRDAVLKKMLNTPPESNKEMVERRERERVDKAKGNLTNKDKQPL